MTPNALTSPAAATRYQIWSLKLATEATPTPTQTETGPKAAIICIMAKNANGFGLCLIEKEAMPYIKLHKQTGIAFAPLPRSSGFDLKPG